MRRARPRAIVRLLGVVVAVSSLLVPSALTARAQPGTGADAQGSASTTGLLAQIRAVAGVEKVTEIPDAATGYRFFLIDFRQLVDHTSPGKGTFTQRLTLLHKGVDRPTLAFTSGYGVSQYPSRSEPTQIVDGNQLSLEYRFFEPSRPAHPNWMRQDTIWQAATDEHVVISAFKTIYARAWLSTGGSKGGMTATYHRRFYPGDVAGSVPYVAPNDVVDTQDVYNAFLDSVGTPACRDALTAIQRRVLSRRAVFLARTRAAAEANGYTFHIVGSIDKAMESSVVDMFFAFWQYQPESSCASLPDAATASDDQVWDFFESISSLTTYADQQVEPYVPYYFQAAFQLGSPEPFETHLADLLRYPGADVAATFVPADIRPTRFDRSAMPDIDSWVSHDARRMLYIYGSDDPWSAEPFTCGATSVARQCYRYYVEGGNHGSSIADLPLVERTRATALVLQWAGLGDGDPAVTQIATAGRPTTDLRLDTATPDSLTGVSRGLLPAAGPHP